MDCYLCDQKAPYRCPRCGSPYCSDHGDVPATEAGQGLCADCLSPVNAVPSGTVFRASLLALLLGSVLALWLLVRPPGLPGESSEIVVPDVSPVASPESVTPTAIPETPTAGPTAEPTAAPTPTPEPTAEPTPEGPIEYVVEEGDTFSGIAAFFGVSVEDLLAVNGFTEEDAQFIQPGDILVIPQ